MSTERARRLAQLRQAYESGILDQDTYQAALAALDAPAETQAEVIGSGAIAQQGAAAATTGGVAVAGSVHGDIYVGPPPQNPDAALVIYHRVLAQACGQLPLRGVDVGASDPTAAQRPLGLANVYVDLDTTTQVELNDAEKKKRDRQRFLPGERGAAPTPSPAAFWMSLGKSGCATPPSPRGSSSARQPAPPWPACGRWPSS